MCMPVMWGVVVLCNAFEQQPAARSDCVSMPELTCVLHWTPQRMLLDAAGVSEASDDTTCHAQVQVRPMAGDGAVCGGHGSAARQSPLDPPPQASTPAGCS